MSKGAHKKGRFQKQEEKEFLEEVIEIDRVTKVVKGGRKMRFRATVVIGNKKGRIGMGIGKSNEVTGAIQKAIAQAKKSLINIKIDGTTIPHEVRAKYKSARILLFPAAEGTGLITGGTVRKVLELAGIKDILSKCLGSSNKINNAKAVLEAVSKLKTTPYMEKRAKTRMAAQQAALAKAQAQKPAPQAQKPTQKPAEKPAHKPEHKPELKPAEKPAEEPKKD